MSSSIDERFEETIDFLYNFLPNFNTRNSQPRDFKLKPIIDFCDYLGNPQENYKTIHIGGTNGKGSTSHLMAYMLQSEGKKVGLYTSPHLIDFRERIRINGEYIDKISVIEFVEKYKDYFLENNLTFFEVMVAMAFYLFSENRVDVAVIEVGLGGTLDSTNIINPILSIITNVSYDHIDILGNNIEEIASNKAGIIKYKTPIVLGDKNETYLKVIEDKTVEMNASLTIVEEVVQIKYEAEEVDFVSEQTDISLKRIQPDYFYMNLRTTLVSYIEYLKTSDTELDKDIIYTLFNRVNKVGLQEVGLMGRWMKTEYKGKKIIFESAHNPAAFQQLSENIKREKYDKLHIVYGTMIDKDIKANINFLSKENYYYLTEISYNRSAKIEELETLFKESDFSNYTGYQISTEAFNSAVNSANKDDLILVTGSIFLIGELLEYIGY